MRLEEIKRIAKNYAGIDIVKRLTDELLTVHAINDRMAEDLADLIRENFDLLNDYDLLPEAEVDSVHARPTVSYASVLGSVKETE
jgi:hypothetical protein